MDKRNLLRRVGDPSQLFGVKDYRLIGSKADGMRAVDLYTSKGLVLTVLPDRGMDIASLAYKGVNLSFMSKTGLTGSPYFCEDGAKGFLKSFYAGFLTTCGLTYMGAACNDNGESLGLHGVISNTPACEVHPSVKWEGDDAVLSVTGKVKEAKVFAEHLVLSRSVSCGKESSRFKVIDTVENLGFEPSPLMILYHFNFGYPMLDAGNRIILPSEQAVPRDAVAEKGWKEHLDIGGPIDGFDEQVFFHKMKSDKEGKVTVALVNDKLELAVLLTYQVAQLPQFTQWKNMRSGEYVLGLEPGNCHVLGRKQAREDGSLPFIAPGETKSFEIEVSVVEGAAEIQHALIHLSNG